MYKSKAEQRREKMIGIVVQGIEIIGTSDELIMMGLLAEGVKTFTPAEFDHSSWVTVTNTTTDKDFIIHSTSMAGLINACKMLGDLESFKTGVMKGWVVSLEILQRSISQIKAA